MFDVNRRIHDLVLALTLGVLLCSTSRAAPDSASGQVVSPAGQPVADAEVIVATPDQPAWVNLSPVERREYQDRPSTTTTTDPAGRFTFAALPKDTGRLVIHHPTQGYAEVVPASLAASPVVKLEPWCRVEGTLRVGARPAPAGTKVRLGELGWTTNTARVFYGYPTTTDEQGRYVLNRVPAGLAKINVQPSETASTVEQYTWAEPGKPTRFDIGGRGRPVIGKLVLPGTGNLDINRLGRRGGLNSSTYFRRDVPWPRQPIQHNGPTDQDQEDEIRAWHRTRAAFETYKDEYRSNLSFQPDGSFRLEDVPPGKYILTFVLNDMSSGRSERVLDKRVDVTVPDDPRVPTDEPLDLGNITAGNEGL